MEIYMIYDVSNSNTIAQVFLTSAKTRAVSVSNDLKSVPGVFQLNRMALGWLNNAFLFIKRVY